MWRFQFSKSIVIFCANTHHTGPSTRGHEKTFTVRPQMSWHHLNQFRCSAGDDLEYETTPNKTIMNTRFFTRISLNDQLQNLLNQQLFPDDSCRK